MSRSLTKVQLLQSCLVVSHSGETAAFARALISEYGGSPDKVRYVCHPVAVAGDDGSVVAEADDGFAPSLKTRRSGRSDEILIWGNILPYKGVLEFISSPAVRVAGLNVRIVGRCKDPGMAKDIEKAVAECDSAELSALIPMVLSLFARRLFREQSR